LASLRALEGRVSACRLEGDFQHERKPASVRKSGEGFSNRHACFFTPHLIFPLRRTGSLASFFGGSLCLTLILRVEKFSSPARALLSEINFRVKKEDYEPLSPLAAAPLLGEFASLRREGIALSIRGKFFDTKNDVSEKLGEG